MAKEELLEFDGTVTEVLPDGNFRVMLDNEHEVLAYTAAMTPLIILLLDSGRPPGMGVLIDRLVATLIGAALVIAANLLFKKLIGKTA